MKGYSERPGTRLVCHLRPGDKVRCRVTQDGGEDWREVLDVLHTQGFMFVTFAAPELEVGELTLQLPGETVVPCQPAPDRIQRGDLAARLARDVEGEAPSGKRRTQMQPRRR